MKASLTFVPPDSIKVITNCVAYVKNLKFLFKFDKQVNEVVKPVFFNIAKTKLFISFKDLVKVIHKFIPSCLDHCNSLRLVSRPCPACNWSKRLRTGS